MKLHANAKTCPRSRWLLVRRVRHEGWSVVAAAEAAGISDRSAYRWLKRFREEGEAGLRDRSSAPQRIPHMTSSRRVEAIEALRRLRMTAAEISELLSMSISTVSAWLKRLGLGKRSRLEPAEAPNRYELARPGQLVHVDVKKLGRINVRGAGHRVTGRRNQVKAGPDRRATGWEFVHVMVDDHSRLAYAEVFQGQGENARQAVVFLRRGLRFFKAHGIQVERVMSDNGSGYVSTAHAIACRALSVRHTRTALVARAPTERPSGSSRPCSTNGPTPASTAAQPNASASSPPSSSATTSDDHTAPSPKSRQDHD